MVILTTELGHRITDYTYTVTQVAMIVNTTKFQLTIYTFLEKQTNKYSVG